jgi:aminoglycoside phosphotransferase (APT) family kinase protein
VLPRARAICAQAASLDCVPPALLRRASQEPERLEPAIRGAGGLRSRLLHGDYGTSNVAASLDADGCIEVVAVFDFEPTAPGDPVEDFMWIADHGLHSPFVRSFLAGYLEHGELNTRAPERFAFYQLEQCLGMLGWAHEADPKYFVQAQWLIEQVLDGARLRLA